VKHLRDGVLAVLRLLPDAALVIDRDLRVRYANPVAVEAFALPPGENFDLSTRLVDPQAFGDFLRVARRVTDLVPGGMEIRIGDGRRNFRCNAARMVGGDEPLVLVLATHGRTGDPFVLLTDKLSDLTREIRRRRETEDALRRSETSLQERALEAERANRAKDAFLATVSHELRTPLQSMLGWARLLASGGLAESQMQRAVRTIERNAVAQAQLIDDLLDVSRIIAGKLEIDLQIVDPVPVLEAAVDALRLAMEAKQLRLQTRMDPDIGMLRGDAPRIQQIVWNLLSNALKFTPEGGTVRLHARRVGTRVEIEVADSGRGIPAEGLERIFQHFTQLDPMHGRSQRGLGLGLAICQHLVDLHGGTIEAHSQGPDRGATFIVKLPSAATMPAAFGTAAPQQRCGDAAFSAPPELVGLHVLVVDDEQDAREIVAEVLSHCGAIVRTSGSVAEAWAAIETELPNVIVSDIGMPERDGHAFLQQLRSLPPERGGAIPAAALTAYANAEDRQRALSSGFHMHVAKPVEPAELVAVVAKLARIGIAHGSADAV
jgi:signal transduction histidine kinase/ActR/RegA family two-component response regulator